MGKSYEMWYQMPNVALKHRSLNAQSHIGACREAHDYALKSGAISYTIRSIEVKVVKTWEAK